MSRTLVRVLVGAILVLAIPIAVPSAVEAQTYDSRCPAMTDSITRLYRAFLGREPDRPGFDNWVGFYSSGQMSLVEIADGFADSEEFSAEGALSNETYVRWIFTNVLESQPSQDQVADWVRALETGLSRGAMMVNQTESYDYVQKTGTVPPLAGYLKTYPKGTHWYCDVGPATEAVNPLLGDVWADYYFRNRGEGEDGVSLWTLNADRSRAVRMREGTLSSGFTDYNWDGVFRGDGDYGRFIEVQVGPSTDWILVFYPHSIGEDRVGWQLDS